jgi:hypothetical protein
MSAPTALDTFSAEHTETPIAAVGTHPVTGRIDSLYFATEAELTEFLRLQGGTFTAFDLNRTTGEWIARPVVGDLVTFRPEAGGARVGVEFIVDDADKGVDPSNGQRMVGLKRTTKGRTGYRLAYAKDLVSVE